MTAQLKQLFTIGIYGFDATAFVLALRHAGVDAVVDIRARRGMRGPQYAWANSRRLQELLADAGIGYLHLPEFSPTAGIRNLQRAADRESSIAKRDRGRLSGAFIEAYEREVLRSDSLARFLTALPDGVSNPAILCVERLPDACHRSLLAAGLHAGSRAPVQDLVP